MRKWDWKPTIKESSKAINMSPYILQHQVYIKWIILLKIEVYSFSWFQLVKLHYLHHFWRIFVLRFAIFSWYHTTDLLIIVWFVNWIYGKVYHKRNYDIFFYLLQTIGMFILYHWPWFNDNCTVRFFSRTGKTVSYGYIKALN